MFFTQAGGQVVCAAAYSGRVAHIVSWGGLIWEVFATRYSHLCVLVVFMI